MTILRRILLLAGLFAARTAFADHVYVSTAGSTVHCDFTTATSVATVLTGTPAVTVYKDGGTSTSTAGVTLTASRGSVVGWNHVAIDTSADGSFFATAHYFDVVITAGTVGGASVVGFEVCSFRLDVMQTGDSYARLGAPAGASVSADIAAEPTANWSAGTRTLTACSFCISAGAVWDEALSSHTTAGTAGKKLSDIPTSGGTAPTALEIANELYNGTTYGPATWTVTGSGGAYFLAQLSRLSSTTITLASIVTSDDILHLVPGTAYTGVRQPKVPFTIDNTWDLTSSTPKLVILDGDTALLSVTGTVTAPGTTAQLVQFSLTAAQTALLTRIGATAYQYQVSATWAADGTALPVVMAQASVDTTTKYF